ncbi:MAG: zinc ABC transporter substrate-binding protein [Elusimicrobia bacterium]|nr:zinc ABC transporter substrate-binding protein [Elusimicrobiota bacterium]
MKYIFKLLIFTLILFLIPKLLFAYSPLPDKKIKIAATTSNIATLLNEICKDKIEVVTIIPVTTSPESYVIDEKTIKEVNKCNIILYHHWQPWVKNLKYELTNIGLVYRELKTRENLMIPYINLKAAQELFDLLSVWDRDNKSFYEQNFLDYSFKVNFVSNEIIKNNYGKYNKKIVCNSKIASFMEWLGFEVVMTYGRENNMSSSEKSLLKKKIKKEKIKYIADNLQDGTDVGRSLSENLNMKYIIISNFVLGNSYINTLKNNIEKINKALE